MKTIYPIKAFSLVLLFYAASLRAQDTKNDNLNRELSLEREYDPSVQDASKVNTLPVIKDPAITKHAIDYAFLSSPADPQREIGKISAGMFKTEREYDKRRGYLNGGIGNHWNINGDLGYQPLHSDKDLLNVYLTHRSSNSSVRYMDGFLKDEQVKARTNDNIAGLDFSHRFTNATLKLNAQYGYSTFNYYGLPTPSHYPLPEMPHNDMETNQVNNLFVIGTGVNASDGAATDFYGDLSFTRLSFKYGMDANSDGIGENTFDLKLGISSPLRGQHRLGIDTRFGYFNYSKTEDIKVFQNFLTGKISPYYLLENEQWKFKIGLNILFHTGDSAKFFASPDLALELNLGLRTILYVNAGGSMKPNSLYGLSRENRYTAPIFATRPSRTMLDAILGLKSGVAPGFWFNLFGGYKYTADDYFFIPEMSFFGFGNLSRTLPLNSQRYYAGLELKYAHLKLFEIVMKCVYNHWSVENKHIPEQTHTDIIPEWKPYGRPRLEAGAGFLLRPMEKMTFSLDYYLASGRRTIVNWNEKMKDISELNLLTSYTINKTFMPYIRLSNMLFQRYEVYYGYPLQEATIMLGININF
ncbi:MAG: TonB-dependent receptor [Tannerellaceae bacterium]|jgi:hypothetical protein|nr:TonB-dependent receptor [Tannerellaceae bacterium]